MFAKIRLRTVSGQQFRFDLIAPNRAVLGSSRPFASRQEALHAISGLQAGKLQGECVTDCTGRYVFQFYGTDGNTVFRSGSFSSERAVHQGKQLAEKIAATAKLVEPKP